MKYWNIEILKFKLSIKIDNDLTCGEWNYYVTATESCPVKGYALQYIDLFNPATLGNKIYPFVLLIF